jgi:thioredoxin reductase (NADPH)
MIDKKTVVIIGGGPAGMSCALWLQHLNFNPILVEKTEVLGGLQRMNASRNKWLLGHPSTTGHEMSTTFERSIKLENIPVFFKTEISGVQLIDGVFHVALETSTGQGNVRAVAVVIATGTRLRKEEFFANVSGIQESVKKGLLTFTPPGTDHLPAFSNKQVAVIGGGDNALETVLSLVRVTQHIHLIVRSQLRAQGWMQEKLYEHIRSGEVSLYTPASLRSCQVRGETLLQLSLLSEGSVKELTVDHTVARVGFTPANTLLESTFSSVTRNDLGYLTTDANSMQTNKKGIYAIGDVCNPINPCVATAIAQGTIAARNIEQCYRTRMQAANPSYLHINPQFGNRTILASQFQES